MRFLEPFPPVARFAVNNVDVALFDRMRAMRPAVDHVCLQGAETGAGAMLVACRLAGLSALEGHYAGVSVRAQPVPPCCKGATVPRRALLPMITTFLGPRPFRKAWPFFLVGRRHSRGSNGDLFPPTTGLEVGVTPSRVVADAG